MPAHKGGASHARDPAVFMAIASAVCKADTPAAAQPRPQSAHQARCQPHYLAAPTAADAPKLKLHQLTDPLGELHRIIRQNALNKQRLVI